MPRILIVDAYPREGRAALRAADGTEGGKLYQRMLERLSPGIACEIVYPADGELPEDSRLGDYAGVVWTGSNLSILDDEDPRVTRQVALARRLLDAGLPNFGSCFAVQLACVARGGHCEANPKGREFGIARKIRLSSEGADHPLYRGKARVFDAFTSHADHVASLPERATLLAGNDWSPVQAAACEDGGSFWAVQYHPEYDLHEVASLARLRERELILQGSFANEAEARGWTERLEALHDDPTRIDLALELDIGPSLLDEAERTREVRNWLDVRVLTSNAS